MFERILALFCALMSAIGMQVLVHDLTDTQWFALGGFLAQLMLSFYVLRAKIAPQSA